MAARQRTGDGARGVVCRWRGETPVREVWIRREHEIRRHGLPGRAETRTALRRRAREYFHDTIRPSRYGITPWNERGSSYNTRGKQVRAPSHLGRQWQILRDTR